MPQQPAERAQKAAQTADAVALVALMISVVLIAITYFGTTMAVFARNPHASPAEITRMLVVTWMSILPVGLLLSALGEVRKALREFAGGRFFSPVAAKAVRSAGMWAAIAMLAKDVVVPSIESWSANSFSPQVAISGVDFALFAFLAFVAAIGRVLELATELKSENEAFV